jgi:hypothetical protein
MQSRRNSHIAELFLVQRSKAVTDHYQAKRAALLLLLAAGLPSFLSGCTKNAESHATALQFEPQPRSLSTLSGIPMTHNPKLFFDGVTSGEVRLLTVVDQGETSRIALLDSSDSGDTFRKPVWVTPPEAKLRTHGENSPQLLGTADFLYVTWNQDGDIRLARSVDWGESFEKPVRISDKPEKAFSGYVSIGVAPNGDVYAIWLDTRDSSAPGKDDIYSLYVARSKDHGATFGKNVKVADHVCECCRPNISFGPNGELLAFWRHIYPGSIRDMTVAVSHDNGETFGPHKRIAEDNWKLEGCPDSGIALARTANRVYAAWLTEAAPAVNGVRFTWSDDAGKTWAPAVLASQKILDANYPSLSAAADGRVELAFQGRNPEKNKGWAASSAFVVEIASDGKLSAPVEVPGISSAVSRPTVFAASSGRVFTAWTSTQDEKSSVYLSRARHM